MNIKGVILCGGRGTRLRPLTYYFQKVMIPVGSKQKPLLEYIVRLLKFHRIEDIVLLVNYKAEQIINYFDDGSRFDVRIKYVYDNPEYQGNAGALYNAYLKGLLADQETLLVYYGDILSNINLSELIKNHLNKKAAATLALSTRYEVSVGVVEVSGRGQVVDIKEKPPLGKPVFIGILVLEGRYVPLIGELYKEGKSSVDIMGDLIPLLVKRKEPVYGYLTDAFWYDVGSTEKYEKLGPELVDKELNFLLG
ncbi:MAG: hypothetical protein DRJ38_07880 [Thermoprotei archaeon]|nr:MAG: hypothetical protein DRJ38_07880 [Thermoprotei archaeon]